MARYSAGADRPRDLTAEAGCVPAFLRGNLVLAGTCPEARQSEPDRTRLPSPVAPGGRERFTALASSRRRAPERRGQDGGRSRSGRLSLGRHRSREWLLRFPVRAAPAITRMSSDPRESLPLSVLDVMKAVLVDGTALGKFPLGAVFPPASERSEGGSPRRSPRFSEDSRGDGVRAIQTGPSCTPLHSLCDAQRQRRRG